MQKMYEYLLDNAGASIVYRIKREILNNISKEEMKVLQSKILKEKDVQYILSNRQIDGWLGNCFHSRMRGAKQFDVCETAIKYLAEKGVSLEHDVYRDVVNAYLTRAKNDPIYEGFEKFYDEYNYSCWGLWLILASGIARVGYENCVDITKAIDYSLNSFFDVLKYNNIYDALSINKSGKYYFKKDVLWPCKYHLEILAFTYSWRTEENISKLAQSIEHLSTFQEIKHPIYTKLKKFYAAPCDAFIQSPVNNFDMNSVSGSWFYKMELLARCGIVPHSNYLKRQVALLKKSIDSNGICQANVDEKYFRNWGAYSGLKLEENWRTEVRKKCDVTFRALLILKYALDDNI